MIHRVIELMHRTAEITLSAPVYVENKRTREVNVRERMGVAQSSLDLLKHCFDFMALRTVREFGYTCGFSMSSSRLLTGFLAGINVCCLGV
jgi:hypothetical protein